VTEHAAREETDLFPLVRAHLNDKTLRRIRAALIAAETVAPTHAHQRSPDSATGNAVVGSFRAIVDRVRDAVHDFTKRGELRADGDARFQASKFGAARRCACSARSV
jgi:hypothetical protein